MVLGRKVVTPSSVTPSDVAAIRDAKRPAHPSQNSRASFTFGDTDQFTFPRTSFERPLSSPHHLKRG